MELSGDLLSDASEGELTQNSYKLRPAAWTTGASLVGIGLLLALFTQRPRSLENLRGILEEVAVSSSESPFYSSGGELDIVFTLSNTVVPVSIIEEIWPDMHVTFAEGNGIAAAASVSAYTKELLTGESPFGGPPGTVKIPSGGSGTDQLNWGEYVAYSRRQVCYIAANIVAGNAAAAYASGLSKLIPPLKCDSDMYKAGFKRSLLGLLAACSVDPTLESGEQGPLLIIAKSTDDLSKAPPLEGEVAQNTTLSDAGLRTCRFRDGSAGNPSVGSIPLVPSSACDSAEGKNVDFMRDGNTLHGQAMVDITAAWIGGYILAAGGCGGFDGGQDERLMTSMPEVMVLSFFMSQHPSPINVAGVSLLVPAYILGARRIFAGFDGTSRDAGPDFNAGRPNVNAAVPFKSDLMEITVNGKSQLISKASPFLGFQSINQMSGLDKDVPAARLNKNPIQLETSGTYGFESQVAAWYNAVSLSFWHPDIQQILKSMVVSVGSGPWGSGVWWGNSQVFFLAAWMGHALAAQTWGQTLPLDYYIYSSFTENPSNQCLVHGGSTCASCLQACDNSGYAGPGSTHQRYCCMEPEPWIPSPGLFNSKPCIPANLATSICGNQGFGDIYDKYVDKSVSDLWQDFKKTAESMDPSKTTLFDAIISH